MLKKRGSKGIEVTTLPYETKVYTNNQVLIPAQLIRSLDLRNVIKARITIEYKDRVVTFEARLLKMRSTDSRQFTIPKSVRENIGINPEDAIKILKIEKLALKR